MSTLLSDLDSNPSSGKEGDLVQQILNEMNGGSDSAPMAPPPPAPANFPSNPGVLPGAMSPTAMASHTMDAGPATAHIVGGSHPTPADFAANMGSYGASYSPSSHSAPRPSYPVTAPKRGIAQKFAEEFKLPILVSILVFVFSLPVVNILFAHYVPSMVLPTGQLTTVGLVIKSFAAGASFWVLQRIIVPLLSL